MNAFLKHGACATALAVGLALGAAAPAGAAETVKLTYLAGFPPAATFVGAFVNGYVPAVDAELAKTGKYRIEWNLAHSGQVVKPRGELEAMQQGLGDIGNIPTGFHADKLPYHKISYVTPFTTQDPVLVANVMRELSGVFPENDAVWASFGQNVLGETVNIENYIILSSKPLAKFSDLKGMKVGGAGPNLLWIEGTGAAGVSSTLNDFYNSLSSGIYQAAIVWPQAAGAFKICEPAPHVLDAGFGAAGVHTLTANTVSWKKLPEEVRAALAKHGATWNEAQAKLLFDGAKAGMEMCAEKFNMKVTKVNDADRKTWAMGLPPLGLDWAKEMAAAGRPGAKYLTAYMDRMRAAKQPIARNWDKE